MINDKRVLIVIPAWNEHESIARTVNELLGELPEVDVLVVDDGSRDDTAAQARGAGALVAPLPFNLGVGGAMRLGYRYGVTHDYDVVIQLDADGQHDPRYIPKMVDALDGADVVIGARFAGEGDYRAGGPRKWAMMVLSAVLSLMAHTRLTDTTSGHRAMNRRAAQVCADWYPVEYLGDTVEVLVHLIRTGHTVRQIPVAMRPRAGGTPSHSPIKAMVYLGRAMIILLLALVRK